eukprot:scaffold10260_cov266-Chaetoceros_neogracile.AAC.44
MLMYCINARLTHFFPAVRVLYILISFSDEFCQPVLCMILEDVLLPPPTATKLQTYYLDNTSFEVVD